MSPRERIEKILLELEGLSFDFRGEFQRDWHGYLGEGIAALRAAVGDGGQPTDIDNATSSADVSVTIQK